MTPTRHDLLHDAIQWMACQIDVARSSGGVDASDAGHERSRLEVAKDRLAESVRRIPIISEFVSEKPHNIVVRPAAIDQPLARAEGRRRFQTNMNPPEQDDLAYIAGAICAQWEEPRAGALAEAWLKGREVHTEELMNSDARTLAILIGTAAAAAVLAIVFLVRRGRTARIPRLRDLAPSPDFQALCDVASGQSNAAGVAARVRDSVAEPWVWTGRDGISKLAADDRRALLDAFAAAGACGVSRIWPAKGDRFDSQRMMTDTRTTKDDRWVVSADVSAARVGFLLGDRVEVHAHVDVCTIDWWLLSRPTCPVGRAIAERADDLVAGGQAGSKAWRAPWGLAHPEDLRKLFDESTLDLWRKRMVAELNPHYLGHPERCLAITGASGDVLESSIMEAEGSLPVGDAIVADVVERDGKGQHGLACPGGSPLLIAIVRTKSVGRGAA